jgi:hypothetical protein
MNNLKEGESKNYDATKVVRRELQSPCRAPFIPAPHLGVKNNYFGYE